VTLVRSRTVLNVDSMGVRCAQMDPVLGRTVVERQQHVLVVDDLRHGLRELRAILRGERLDGGAGVLFVLGVVDVRDRRLRCGLRGLRQGVEHVGCFVNLMPTSA
jgi:hypothetical protein